MKVSAAFIYASLFKYPPVQMNKTEPSIRPQKYKMYTTHIREYGTKLLFVCDL